MGMHLERVHANATTTNVKSREETIVRAPVEQNKQTEAGDTRKITTTTVAQNGTGHQPSANQTQVQTITKETVQPIEAKPVDSPKNVERLTSNDEDNSRSKITGNESE